MISRYSGIKWNLKTVTKGQTQFINLCAPELDRWHYESEAVMAASLLSLVSGWLHLHCTLLTTEERKEESVLGYMSKASESLKWLPSANQNDSCYGKSVREIQRVKAGRDKGMKESATEVWITKHSTIWLFINLNIHPSLVFHSFFSVHFLLMFCSRSASFYSQALLRPSMSTGAMATRQWLQQSLSEYGNQHVCLALNIFMHICHLRFSDKEQVTPESRTVKLICSSLQNML